MYIVSFICSIFSKIKASVIFNNVVMNFVGKFFTNMFSKLFSKKKKNNSVKYGWKPDVPDFRDFKFSAITDFSTLPKEVDLRYNNMRIFDQGALGSCTANAISSAHMFNQAKNNEWKAKFTPSRLFIYFNERAIEGTIPFDSGAMIRTGIKSLAKQGVCSENTWPYIIKRFRLLPSPKSYTEAVTHKSVQYSRVGQTLEQLKACLASGYPFVFGFAVYDGFESEVVAKTGVVNMPASSEKMRGGHAVLCVGYSDKTQRFIVQNSWGQNWGNKGFFTLPYEYVTNNNLADDFWVVQSVL